MIRNVQFFRYIEVFESRQSILERAIKEGATNERGFNENRPVRILSDRSPPRRGGGRLLLDRSPPRRGGGRLLLDPSPPPRRGFRDSVSGGGFRRDSYRDRSHDRGCLRYKKNIYLIWGISNVADPEQIII